MVFHLTQDYLSETLRSYPRLKLASSRITCRAIITAHRACKRAFTSDSLLRRHLEYSKASRFGARMGLGRGPFKPPPGHKENITTKMRQWTWEDPTSHDSDSDSDNEKPMQIPDLPTMAAMKYWKMVPVLIEIKRFVSRSQPTNTLFKRSRG